MRPARLYNLFSERTAPNLGAQPFSPCCWLFSFFKHIVGGFLFFSLIVTQLVHLRLSPLQVSKSLSFPRFCNSAYLFYQVFPLSSHLFFCLFLCTVSSDFVPFASCGSGVTSGSYFPSIPLPAKISRLACVERLSSQASNLP